MADTANPGAGSGHSGDGETRRDFLYLTAAAMGVVGIVEQEAAGLDDVDGDPQAGAQAQQRAGVLRNIGLEKNQSHGVDFLPGKRRFRALRSW